MLRVAEIYECLSSQPRLQSQEWGKTLRGKGLVQVLKKTVSCLLVLGPTFSPRWKEGATGKTLGSANQRNLWVRQLWAGQ